MSWFVLALSAVVFFVAMWLVVPAPTMTLLPLAVGGPEMSPLLLVPAVLVAVLAWRTRGRPRPGMARPRGSVDFAGPVTVV